MYPKLVKIYGNSVNFRDEMAPMAPLKTKSITEAKQSHKTLLERMPQRTHRSNIYHYCRERHFSATLESQEHWSVKRWTIRIYHECEGRIEKSVPMIAVWHHEACRVMTNGDPERRIFLSYPHTNNGCIFLLTTVFI